MSYGVLEYDIVMLQKLLNDFVIKDIVKKEGGDIICIIYKLYIIITLYNYIAFWH